jgi:hypothetical protein
MFRVVDFYVRALLLLLARTDATRQWAERLGARQEALSKKLKSKARARSDAPAPAAAPAAAAEPGAEAVELSPLEAFAADEDYAALVLLGEEARSQGFCCAKR